MFEDELTPAYLGWGIAISVLVSIPTVLYGHWAVSFMFTPMAFLFVSLVGFTLLSWAIFAVIDPQWEPFVVTWSLVPIGLYVVFLFTGHLIANIGWGLGVDYPLGYQALAMPFAVGAGYTLSRAGAELAATYPRIGRPIAEHQVVVLVLLLLIPVAFAGVAIATPPDTSIEDVEPGFDIWTADDEHDETLLQHSFSDMDYTIGVTLSLEAETQRVVVETPGGDTFFEPIAHDATETDEARIFVRAKAADRGTYETGTYTIRLESIWGQTLDETTLEVDEEPSLTTTETNVTHEEDGTTARIAFEYHGDFPTYFGGTTYPFVEIEEGTDIDATAGTHLWGPVMPGDERTLEIIFTDADGDRITLSQGSYELSIRKTVGTANVDDFQQNVTIDLPGDHGEE